MEYLYRDASSYKAWAAILLEGAFTQQDEAALRSELDSGEYFTPSKVGIEDLQPQIWSAGFPPNDDDHEFHEFVELRPATNDELKDMTVWGSVGVLMDCFQRCNWRSKARCGESPKTKTPARFHMQGSSE